MGIMQLNTKISSRDSITLDDHIRREVIKINANSMSQNVGIHSICVAADPFDQIGSDARAWRGVVDINSGAVIDLQATVLNGIMLDSSICKHPDPVAP